MLTLKFRYQFIYTLLVLPYLAAMETQLFESQQQMQRSHQNYLRLVLT